MTVRELDNAFKLYLNKVDSQAVADFLPLERQQFLNDAQLWLANKVCSNKSQDQDSVDMRRTLSTLSPELIPTVITDSASVQLPLDYLHYALARVVITVNKHRHQQVPTVVEEDELLNILNDPFNRPTLMDPFLCFTRGVLEGYPSNITSILLTYYRKPKPLVLATPTQQVELTDSLILTLIQRAVQLALESITDSRVQTQNSILTSTI